MSLGMLLLRLVVGGTFAVHGYAKLFGGKGKTVSPAVTRYLGPGFAESMQRGLAEFAEALEGLGVPMPRVLAYVVGLVEITGGILLALGWFTRPAALLLAIEMAVAIRKVHWPHGLVGPGGAEFALSMLGGSLALLFTGPGKLSLDRLMCRDNVEASLDELQTALRSTVGRR